MSLESWQRRNKLESPTLFSHLSFVADQVSPAKVHGRYDDATSRKWCGGVALHPRLNPHNPQVARYTQRWVGGFEPHFTGTYNVVIVVSSLDLAFFLLAARKYVPRTYLNVTYTLFQFLKSTLLSREMPFQLLKSTLLSKEMLS